MASIKLKDPSDLSFIIGRLISDIFSITETVISTIASHTKMYWPKKYDDSGYSYGYATGAHYWYGGGIRDFMDELNFSSWVVDYTLAEVFTDILVLLSSQQSASVTLKPNGVTDIKGEKVMVSYPDTLTEVGTPTYLLQEYWYKGELILQLGQAALWFETMSKAADSKRRAASAKPAPDEAL
jgi:hypothetical protein